MRFLRPLPLLVVVIAACGQTGPLVLPEQTLAPPPSAPPVAVTPADDDEPDDAGRTSESP
ncbi:MAG: LPS translocon maturation chaperone LptM [Sinimarinibacterium flocculans]|jgi:predicted small lipoprotein YifL|uniref:LPS translocon maturation chaperone LptM n=1 Tax=Sinimarinibacterium flocculans TaxID=985250 RepID=UPI0024908979|nr:lipoprotein [Sinimarinibacterium flocculans]